MTPEQRRARGYAAQALIEDETLQAGWAQIENDIHSQWENSGPFARRKRERLHTELTLLRRLRGKLASFASNGRE